MLVTESCVAGAGGTDVPRPERAGRPPPCRRCGSPAWWNGWRLVFAVVMAGVTGKAERCARWLARGKCSSCKRGFTCYPDDQYPHRQYQLDAVAHVVSAMAIGGESAAKAAERVEASRTSARRWTAWVSDLVDLSALLGVTQRLDQDVSVGDGMSVGESPGSRRSWTARILAAFEHLGEALVREGLVPGCTTGLGRVLGWQLRAHGDVVYLVTEPRGLSPGMALEVARGGM